MFVCLFFLNTHIQYHNEEPLFIHEPYTSLSEELYLKLLSERVGLLRSITLYTKRDGTIIHPHDTFGLTEEEYKDHLDMSKDIIEFFRNQF
jgi:hypothetical protein